MGGPREAAIGVGGTWGFGTWGGPGKDEEGRGGAGPLGSADNGAYHLAGLKRGTQPDREPGCVRAEPGSGGAQRTRPRRRAQGLASSSRVTWGRGRPGSVGEAVAGPSEGRSPTPPPDPGRGWRVRKGRQ